MERAKEGGARQLAVAYSPPISKDVRPGDPPDSASPFRVTKGAAASWPHGAAAEFPCRPPFTILCSRKGSSSSARSPRERQSRECDRCVKLWPVGRVSLLAAHGFVGPNREAIINTPQRVTSRRHILCNQVFGASVQSDHLVHPNQIQRFPLILHLDPPPLLLFLF